jgi:hypothetical protein
MFACLADTVRNVHTAATVNLASLASFGVTAAKLTALKAKIDAYAASIAKPRDARASTKTATEQMDGEFNAALRAGSCVVSQEVLDEASEGDVEQARRRLAALVL